MAARLSLNLSHLAVRPPGRAGARLPIFGERGAEMRGIRLIECRDGGAATESRVARIGAPGQRCD